MKEARPSRQTFFGLSNEYAKDIYEAFFYMIKDANWSFFELYSLPVRQRDWFINLLIKHKQKENEVADSHK